ncbi:MAG TPA: hypothetical protein VFO86_03505 [Terriglobia bacterium]|nr:hypothetical protein [Terriglobia bacterium]
MKLAQQLDNLLALRDTFTPAEMFKGCSSHDSIHRQTQFKRQLYEACRQLRHPGMINKGKDKVRLPEIGVRFIGKSNLGILK